MTQNRIYRQPGPAEAAEACAAHILDRLEQSLRSRSRATLAISGGNSPRPMFEIFSKQPFEWGRVDLFWVDERHVPRNDPQSNFKLARDTWLAPGGFPPVNIHAVDTSLEPKESARRYEQEIRRCFQLAAGVIPEFDVIHLGMGPDCHTASLFPGEPLIADRQGLAGALWVEKMKQWRITLLPGVLIAAREAVMLITGSDKAEPLSAALYEPYDPAKYPAQLITQERGDAALFLDEAAARLIRS